MRNLYRLVVAAFCGLAVAAPAGATAAIEYFHSGYGHYFVTASASEIAALDTPGSGWSRTGEAFGVFAVGTPGAVDVCRFWTGQRYAPKSSHFYTTDAAECATLRTNPDWQYEGYVFAVAPTATGTCTGGLLPLYRLYNESSSGAPNHRYTTRASIREQMITQGWRAEGAGVGVIACVPPSGELQTITGHVVDGLIEGALVCLDADRNGRCSSGEPQATTDASGTYRLSIPGDSTAPLIAEVVAGVSRDPAEPQSVVDVSYRMSSPSRDYGTDITPYSTMVHVTRLSNYRLAEDVVRARLGLPPTFDIKLSAPAAQGSLKQSVARLIVRALKANASGIDLSAPDALESIVASFSSALTEMPRLVITTRDYAPIESREVYVDATYVLTNPAAAVPTVTLNGRIRGRGHSTWGQPKNPYKVQFNNDSAYGAIGDVLGMKKQRNWALLADYFDRSLMRNKLALSMGSSSVFADGIKWTPSGVNVEVWLNNDYVGVYLLTEDIRIDPARLAIKKMGANDVDGGYIVEVDDRLDCYQGEDLDLSMVTARGVRMCVDTPDEESITPAQLAYVKNLVAEVERDLYDRRSLARINPASFVDWYLIEELFRNVDANFFSSDFMWKDSDSAANPKDRLVNMGPLWDFDRGAGNVNYSDAWMTEGCWVSKGVRPNWFAALFDHPDFVALTLSRWQQKRPALETFVNESITAYAQRLRVAQQRNFQRWPIFGQLLTNYYVLPSHDAEVAFVRQWLNERMAWLDRAYASPEAFATMCK